MKRLTPSGHVDLGPNYNSMLRLYLHPRKIKLCLLSVLHSRQDDGCVGGDSGVGWQINDGTITLTEQQQK